MQTDIPDAARMYDLRWGSKDDFPVGREAAKRARTFVPEIRGACRGAGSSFPGEGGVATDDR